MTWLLDYYPVSACLVIISPVPTNFDDNIYLLLLLGRLEDCMYKVSSSEFRNAGYTINAPHTVAVINLWRAFVAGFI